MKRETIQAQVGESAIGTLTQIYDASLDHILGELLQNSRRAGASKVDITIEEDNDANTNGDYIPDYIVKVEDDGTGFVDPQLLLTYGESGWNASLAKREKPAGMGLLSLAQRGCTVRSTDNEGTSWQVTIKPEHFAGKQRATVHRKPGKPTASTTVTFLTGKKDLQRVVDTVKEAALHYPLVVTLTSPTTGNGRKTETLDRRPFLDEARHTEEWNGLRIGARMGMQDIGNFCDEPSRINVYGIVARGDIGRVETLKGDWWADVDVIDCPKLELVLPGRRTLVETPFLTALQVQAKCTVYRAMAKHPDPRPTYGSWSDARARGIAITPPPAQLERWTACSNVWEPQHEEKEALEPKLIPCNQGSGRDVLLMRGELEAPMAQSLHRAIQYGRSMGRTDVPALAREEPKLEGYAWYDSIPIVTDVEIEYDTKDGTEHLDDLPVLTYVNEPRAQLPQRPEAIRIVMIILHPDGTARIRTLDTDVALGGEPRCGLEGAWPLIETKATIKPKEIAHLMKKAYFAIPGSPDDDTWDYLEAVFEEQALHIANRLVACDKDAHERTITSAVEREILKLVPPDRTVEITVKNQRVEVSIGAAKKKYAHAPSPNTVEYA